MAKPKVLLYDIETFPNKVYTWGIYDQNVIEVMQHWYMLSYAWKWLGEKETHVTAICDYKGYKIGSPNDKRLMRDLWKLFDDADVIIGHNGRAFDIKKSNARFAKYGMKPPSPYQIIDTKEVAKRYFRFDSNKLDSLADYFGIGRKINTGGFALWLACERGEKKSWDLMKKYNKHDVDLLEKVYLHMLPYMNNHPNMALLSGNKHACPNCSSMNVVQQGIKYTRANIMQRWQCKDCRSWHSSPMEHKNSKEKQIR